MLNQTLATLNIGIRRTTSNESPVGDIKERAEKVASKIDALGIAGKEPTVDSDSTNGGKSSWE